MSRKNRESASVISLALEPVNGLPMAAPLPGQFVVLRLGLAPGAPPQMRSYSLSGEPKASCYRISVKREVDGLAGAFIDERVRIGDVLEMSAPRGNFTLISGRLSCGPTERGKWGRHPSSRCCTQWRPRGRCGKSGGYMEPATAREHPFAEEVRNILKTMARVHSYVFYSAPRCRR